jgi:deoxyribonucleoside regulator
MSRANHPSDRTVAEAAWLYYIKGLNQSEIAKKMKLSRPTIITYLRLARERQIVGVKIAGMHFQVNELADALCKKFGLESASVVPSEGADGDTMLQVCEAAAQLLPDFGSPGDTLGVSWGQTVSFVSERVPWWPVDNLVVRQLIGSLANPLLPTCESCTTEIARRLSAHCINKLAEQLRAEPIIAEQLSHLKDCNKAIYSLSPCTEDTHVVQFNIATKADIADYVAKGAVGIIAGRFINADGAPVLGDLDARMIGADQAALRKMSGLLVVSGLEKLAATRAALCGGYVTHVVLDMALAKGLVEGSQDL